jgi:hypothetical protein
VPGELVEFDERSLIKQRVYPLARRLLSARMLLLDRTRRPGVDGLVVTALEIGELARGGVRVGDVRERRSCHGSQR